MVTFLTLSSVLNRHEHLSSISSSVTESPLHMAAEAEEQLVRDMQHLKALEELLNGL